MAQTYSSQIRKDTRGAQQDIHPYANPRRVALLALLAIIGQALMFATAWFLPLFSEYHLISDNISELVLGRFGFLQTLAFLIAGLTTLGFAYVIRQSTAGEPGSFTGTLLIGIYGIGAMLVAIFPTNRIDQASDVFLQSPTGIIHSLTALVSFASIVIAMFVLARTFGSVKQLRSLLRLSVLLAGAALSLLIVQGESPLVGLLERLMVAAISAWIVIVSLKVRSIARSQSTGAFHKE